MSDGEINYQCWICPECSDDHLMDGPCSPPNTKPFSPPLSDQSYIAVKFRELESELSRYRAALKVMKEALEFYQGESVVRMEWDENSGASYPCEGCDFDQWGNKSREALLEADRILNFQNKGEK